MTSSLRRSGAETKAEIQRVALSLFGSQGYEATSLRQIADVLGIQKASLYYHFRSKEEIVTSGLMARGDDAAELLEWARAQPPSADLARTVVLRWVDSLSIDKLRGIRFVAANPAVMRTMSVGGIRNGLEAVIELIAEGEIDVTRRLLLRMALLSINAAVSAAEGTDTTDEEIVRAARESARAILDRL